jgi:hypothetical protein
VLLHVAANGVSWSEDLQEVLVEFLGCDGGQSA